MALQKNGWNPENAINAFFNDPSQYNPQSNAGSGAASNAGS
jgi:hypothetical protein